MDFAHPLQAVIPGAQGRVLAVLSATTAELNLRTIARLADVSVAQCSRVLPRLVELGIVERREVPPSSLFRFCRQHVAAEPLLELLNLREHLIERMAATVSSMSVPPASVMLFGSMARGEASVDSDIDVLVVRPQGLDDDVRWSEELEEWRTGASMLAGNTVELLEVTFEEALQKAGARSGLWSAIRKEGVLLAGVALEDLRG